MAGLTLLESADHLYQRASEALLQQFAKGGLPAPVIAKFLAFLNNNAANAITLLNNMLARRDQWLDINNQLALQTAGAPEEMQSARNTRPNCAFQVLKAATESLPTQHQTKIKSVYASLFPEAIAKNLTQL